MFVTLGNLGARGGTHTTEPPTEPPTPPPTEPPPIEPPPTEPPTEPPPSGTIPGGITYTTYYPPADDRFWKPDPLQDPLYLRQINPAKAVILATAPPAFDWTAAAAVATIAGVLWMMTRRAPKK